MDFSTEGNTEPPVENACEIEIETLIVGFGFSVVPLLRELELRGQHYTLISQGDPIWQQLAKSDRLNFDLVSSFHASFYAQDQVEAGTVANYYPTAREFHAYHERLFAQYRDKVVVDTVCEVENYPDHSFVRTTSGTSYRTRNLVFATGLGRPQNETIKTLDLSEVENQTLVFDAVGDTTNMMVARAVPQGNRVILLNNGFITLDKYAVLDIPGPKGSEWYIPLFGVRTGKRYPIDLAQGEAHTIERLWPSFYKDLFALPMGPSDPESLSAKLFLPHAFHNRYPETYRRESVHSNRGTKAGFCNGLIGIKYWPIDMYEQRFGDELEESIRNGVLMNDIVFYHTQKLVETWPKDRTTVDLENKTISRAGRTVPFDRFIRGGHEEPRLPPIVAINEDGLRHVYSYDYRDSYLGVVPAKLRKVYFIGYTRPFSGGLANITEMQGLMVHKLVSKPEFAAELYGNIGQRIAQYNGYYYPKGQARRSTDHLVHYGAYTNDVAHAIGIERKLSRALSWNPWRTFQNLRFELLHPNNALKFRMASEYKVEGADTYCRRIAAHYENWVIVMFLVLSTLWDRLLGYLCLLLLFSTYALQPFVDPQAGIVDAAITPHVLAWGVLCAGLGVLFHRNLRFVNIVTYSLAMPLQGLKSTLQPIAMIYIALRGDWYLCPLLFGLWASLAFGFRQFFLPPVSGRYLFADCKYKHRYRPFWLHYKEVYQQVRAEQRAQAISMAPPRDGARPETGARV